MYSARVSSRNFRLGGGGGEGKGEAVQSVA